MPGNRCELSRLRRWLYPQSRRVIIETGSFSFPANGKGERARQPFTKSAVPPPRPGRSTHV